MLNTLDWVVGVPLALAIYIAVCWIVIFLVPAVLSTLFPNPTARLKVALAKVEAMYGADKETYHIALALVCFAIVAGMATLLVVLAFGGDATGSGRFKISTAYQRVYRFFAYLGTDPVFAGVGTFVTGIGLVYAAVAGYGQFADYLKKLIARSREASP
jgi:hypothetical protein